MAVNITINLLIESARPDVSRAEKQLEGMTTAETGSATSNND